MIISMNEISLDILPVSETIKVIDGLDFAGMTKQLIRWVLISFNIHIL